MDINGRNLKGESLPLSIEFSKAHVVLVTGWAVNTCGHILLYFPGGSGHYFHFDGPGIWDYPRYLDGDKAYRNFLRGSRKEELHRVSISIPNPHGARMRLEELMNGKWLTFIVSHNCATFAASVVNAGGNFWTLPQHCPVLDVLINEFFGKYIRERFGKKNAAN